MVNFWSISMFLVLLKPVSRAEFKYVCIVWIGNQIREIFTADSRCRVKCRSGPIFTQIFSNVSGAALLLAGLPRIFPTVFTSGPVRLLGILSKGIESITCNYSQLPAVHGDFSVIHGKTVENTADSRKQ